MLARQNWIVIVFLAAIIASFVVSNHDSAARDRAQAAQLVSGCDRTSARTLLFASYQQQTADVRRAGGTKADMKAADEYESYALGTVSFIPLPRDVKPTNLPRGLRMAVVMTKNANGDTIKTIRPDVKKILHQGCVEAYS